MPKCIEKTFIAILFLFVVTLAHAGNWFAIVFDGKGSWGIARGQPSKEKAIKEAIATCNGYSQVGCKRILEVKSKAGFLVLATSPSQLAYGLSQTNKEDAQNFALNQCAQHTPESETCSIVFSQPNGNVKLQQSNAIEDCRPRTSNLTCQSQCANGNCVVRYSNGCEMRVQVPSRFNPFNNQWEYPSPSC